MGVEATLEGLHKLFRTTVDPSRVAAIIIEPVLGEGGSVPAPAAYLCALRELCTQHGILLIADEIQSGVEPDLPTFVKSIGGGLPLSGVTGKAGIMGTRRAGRHPRGQPAGLRGGADGAGHL